ncbi:quinol:electron acceptor oxidoreductase subunit ActD [Fundidesulfovibrio soli]|uniref:quinol:electron acceptor oxidoreductase subunit ActD n=1 Tax=Fundidesulfovibrio soli TaxID=2922716 RepID=UPI001FAEBC66|nr:quinol:electron acceptor oxidoreductase subunit ActD [Fundidesulfovibrio soli]
MSGLTLRDVNRDTLEASRAPKRRSYWLALALTAASFIGLLASLLYQAKTGMGVTGLKEPVNWGLYIGNFVFWVGIAHSGTLISAILFLLRARWRDSVSRSAEAMTVFAVMTAGLFPLIHLGRIWRFYYIIPYPSQRQLWPNFVSPLIWDELAVGTYLIVSTIFFAVGLIPDVAAARDWSEEHRGPLHWKTRLFSAMALGWSGAASQWRHYERSYLFFAALATPLVVSVHSVVSWDFAMGILTGWHTTIYAPYFVSGAVHSGLAMVLLLVIPMRRILKLERLVQDKHLDMLAKTILVTTFLMAYFYLVDPFIAWYSGDIYERQFMRWQAMSQMGLIYWSLMPLNILLPATLVFRPLRRSKFWLMAVSLAIIAGMYLERVMIVTGSPAHDFMPHNWGHYFPSWVELTITAGSFGFFSLLFLIFSKLLPTMPIGDLKAALDESRVEAAPARAPLKPVEPVPGGIPGVMAVYDNPAALIEACSRALSSGYTRLEAFSPYKMPKLQEALGTTASPVRFWTLAGALAGFAGGWALALGASLVNNLLVGGKGPFAYVPFWIPGVEMLILFGCLSNLAAVLYYAKLYRLRPIPRYDRRFSRDRFGLFIAAAGAQSEEVRDFLAGSGAEEVHVHH